MYFNLFESVRIVTGARRSALYNLTLGELSLVPNGMSEIVKRLRKSTVEQVRNTLSVDNIEVMDEYLEWLISKHYGNYTEKPESYVRRNDKYETPNMLDNAIIEGDGMSQLVLERSVAELVRCRCKFIELRMYRSHGLDIIRHLLGLVNRTSIRGIRIVVPYDEEVHIMELRDILKSDRLVYQVIVHGCMVDSLDGRVEYRKEKVLDAFCCGKIDRNTFLSTYSSWTLANSVNSCLHGKVSIGPNGEIRNCPAGQSLLGVIGNGPNLKTIVKELEESKEWNITKDAVDICRDCEFRYACTDCRMIRANPNSMISKPLKCGYNPYTNEWKEWADPKALLTLNIIRGQASHE